MPAVFGVSSFFMIRVGLDGLGADPEELGGLLRRLALRD